MANRYLQIASTPSVTAARSRYGGGKRFVGLGDSQGLAGIATNDVLSTAEQDFIAARDGFYIASVSETGWPYVQFRGGPKGFLKVINQSEIGFSDFRGNLQYVTVGNVTKNDRVSLLLMDYAERQRLKIFGRLRIHDPLEDPATTRILSVGDYRERVERLIVIAVEAFDWNCPRHITPRLTQDELNEMLLPVRDEVTALRAENLQLRKRLATGSNGAPPT